MQISQTANGELVVHDGYTFNSFSFTAHGSLPLADTEAVTFVDGYAWVSIDALKTSYPLADDLAWRSGVDRMIDYARQKGWVGADDDRVRAHIESA